MKKNKYMLIYITKYELLLFFLGSEEPEQRTLSRNDSDVEILSSDGSVEILEIISRYNDLNEYKFLVFKLTLFHVLVLKPNLKNLS